MERVKAPEIIANILDVDKADVEFVLLKLAQEQIILVTHNYYLIAEDEIGKQSLSESIERINFDHLVAGISDHKQLYSEVCQGYVSRTPDSKLGKITVDPRCTWNGGSIGVRDTYESQIQSIQEFYSQFIMIGKQMAKKASEPMYVVQTFGLGCNHGGTSLCVDHWYNPNIRHECYYRLDQLKEAMKAKDAVAKRRGDTKDIGRKPWTKFRILIPEAIQANPAKDYGGKGSDFINTAETLIESFGNPNAAGMALMLLAMS
jgi:hypothetical protein